MTWMVVRLFLSLALVGLVLWFAARVAKKRGIGGTGNGLIEVVARQRMGRTSTVNVVRIGDVVLVVGATEEQVTLLAEVDPETIEVAAAAREELRPVRAPLHSAPARSHERASEDDHDAADDLDAPGYAEPRYADERVPEARRPVGGGMHRSSAAARSSAGPLAGSVFDRNGWGSFVNQMRERTVRRP